ncbi:MAG: ExbD/TolR family protein [Pseudomonadota bacterium]
MKRRRLRKEPAHLEITAFINLVVVLVPFLLSTAVFTRLAVIDLSLPAKTSGVEQLKTDNLQLEVVIRKGALEVGDRIGGLIQRIPAGADGAHDVKALAALMVQLKAKFPDKREATVLAEPDTAYDTIVQVMDAMRDTNTGEGSKVVKSELFPGISLGDAPVRTAAAK